MAFYLITEPDNFLSLLRKGYPEKVAQNYGEFYMRNFILHNQLRRNTANVRRVQRHFRIENQTWSIANVDGKFDYNNNNNKHLETINSMNNLIPFGV